MGARHVLLSRADGGDEALAGFIEAQYDAAAAIRLLQACHADTEY